MILETHDHHLAHPSRHANELVGRWSASGIDHRPREPVLKDALAVLVDDLQETLLALIRDLDHAPELLPLFR